jgi:hypothetical protein
VLSAAAGMHRFVWDLHYPEPDVLEHEYPISAIYHDTPRYPLGAAVLPGNYTVKLSAEGKTYSELLEISMDRRVKTSPEDLRSQFELDRKIADALHRDFDALQQARSLRSQLKSIAGRGPGAEITKAIAELDAKAAQIEGSAGGFVARFLSTPEGRSLARLNGGLSTLLSALDSADAAPTTQQVAMFTGLEKALDEQLTAWAQIKSKDVPAINQRLKKAGLPLIDVQKAVPGAADSAQTGSQDRDKDVE